MLAILLAALDQTIVATALPTIVGDLGGLPAGSSWILTRLAKQGAVAGEELARQANVPMDHGRPFVDRLVSEGMVVRSNGTLVLTDSGHEAADRLFAARREGLRELLADFSPDEYAELGELLTKLSRALLGDNADRLQPHERQPRRHLRHQRELAIGGASGAR